MPVYKFTDGRKGWYFQFYFQGTKIKYEKFFNQHMDSKSKCIEAESYCKNLLDKGLDRTKIKGKLTRFQLDKLLKESLNGCDGISLYDMYDNYVSLKINLKVGSQKNYKTFKNNFLTLIEDEPISLLSSNDFALWMQRLLKKDCTTYYKNRAIKIMISLLDYGMKIYKLDGNLQIPLIMLKDNNAVEENNKLEEYIPVDCFNLLIKPLNKANRNHFYYYVIIYILYYTGLRISELSALTINDYRDGYFNINKDVVRVNASNTIQSPKTLNSVRKVHLDIQCISLMDSYIETFKPTNIIFKRDSDYLNQQKLRRVLTKLAKETGLDSKYHVHPHALRHSHSTNLKNLGFSEYAISKRLGNTPQVASSTYIHSTEEEQLQIIDSLNKKASN